MAEFKDVIEQQKRMCMTIGKCGKCPLRSMDYDCRFMAMIDADYDAVEVEAIERIVMDWAAAHPELVYPSWNEAWKQLFPDMAKKDPPCFRYFISSARLEEFCPGMRCETCRNQPLFADIAEKLGIKPIGGDADA